MQTIFSAGQVFLGENETLAIPRGYARDGSKMGIIYCHNLGGSAQYPALDGAGEPNFQRILQTLVDIGGFPVIFQDMGGQTWDNDTALARVTASKAFLQQLPTVANGFMGGGAKAGKVGLFCWSMGGSSSVRWAADNPTLVACMAGLQPLSDINDLRNFNRPNGWTGVTPNAPLNVRSANVGLGLPQDSTSDYPTHGASLAALPAGTDPTTHFPTGIPAKAWYSTDDVTVPPATVTHLWRDLMGGTAVAAGTGGHGDAGLAGVNGWELVQFFAQYQT